MYRFLLAIFSLLFPLSVSCAHPAQAPLAPNPGAPLLSVLTFNVNYGVQDAPGNLRAIVEADADLVLLQEATPALERATRHRLKSLYPHQLYRHCCTAGGLGVLSKHPLKEGEYLDSPIGWFPGWWVRVDSPLGRVQVLLVHLRPPISDGGSWVSGYFTTGGLRLLELKTYMDRRDPDLPVIVAGDFNEARGEALAFLEEAGLSDAVRAFRPRGATWRWKTSVGTLRFALDHVFHDVGLRALDVEIIDAGASDHLPVKVRFESVPGG